MVETALKHCWHYHQCGVLEIQAIYASKWRKSLAVGHRVLVVVKNRDCLILKPQYSRYMVGSH